MKEKSPNLKIYGNDWDTSDGTCIRDYIHVMDVSKAHINAIKYINDGFHIYNLGRGSGCSVYDIINEMKKKSNKDFNVIIEDKRNGEAKHIYADSSLANYELNWKCDYDLSEMCRDSWNYYNKSK